VTKFVSVKVVCEAKKKGEEKEKKGEKN